MKYSDIKIVTQRLRLVPVSRSDWRLYHKLYGNPKVMQYFDSGQVKTEEETKKLIDSFVDRWENRINLSKLLENCLWAKCGQQCCIVMHCPAFVAFPAVNFTFKINMLELKAA